MAEHKERYIRPTYILSQWAENVAQTELPQTNLPLESIVAIYVLENHLLPKAEDEATLHPKEVLTTLQEASEDVCLQFPDACDVHGYVQGIYEVIDTCLGVLGNPETTSTMYTDSTIALLIQTKEVLEIAARSDLWQEILSI